MKTKRKKTPKKQVVPFEPTIVTFLVALVAVLTLVFFAYLGVIFS